MDQSSLIATAFKMTVALGAVLLTFGVALLIARKFSGISPTFMKKMGTRKTKPMEILAFQSLGPGRGIYLVRCLNQKILIGATSQSINQLSEISDDEENESSETEFASSLSEQVASEGVPKSKTTSGREIYRV